MKVRPAARWIFPPERGGGDPAAAGEASAGRSSAGRSSATRLRDELGLSLPAAAALVARGIDSPAEAARFLDPRLSSLSSYEEIAGIGEAAAAVERAVAGGRPIAVFGDYDVDGITAATLLQSVLIRLGADARVFLPSRSGEGYGLSPDAVARCLDHTGASMVVTVDCGIRAAEVIRDTIRARDVEFVVTDHHDPGDPPETACPVVNPWLGAPEAARHLAGVGVAFKLAHALVAAGRRRGDPRAAELDLRDDLDLVAVGTVADIVPLVGDNRILVRHGLRRLEQSPRIGLAALMETAAVRPPLRAHHVGFRLGPRLNAAGRLDGDGAAGIDASVAFELLAASDPARARDLAGRLDKANALRQRCETEIFDAAVAACESVYGDADPAGIVVDGAGWNPGVIGIVASRLARRYGRPTVVIARTAEPGDARGSGRSVTGVSLVKCLENCAGWLERFGGHPMAAGLTIDPGRIDSFRGAFDDAVRAAAGGAPPTPVLEIDATVRTCEMDRALAADLDRLRPFGAGNREPVLAVLGVRIRDQRSIGAEARHSRFVVEDDDGSIEAVAWNHTPDDLPAPGPRGTFDVAGRVRIDDYQGRERVRFQIEAVRSAAAE